MKTIAGIPLRIGPGAAALAALVTWILANQWIPEYGSASWLVAAITAVALSASILIHELAHAFVARRYGIGTRSIGLALFGGVAQLERDTESPTEEIRIAGAGPLASLALAIVAGGVLYAASVAGAPGLALAALGWLAAVNAILGVTNLIPALPLDGGRVLTGLLWRRRGDRLSAVTSAATLGRFAGAALIAFGIYQFVSGTGFGLWSIAIGWMIRQSAVASVLREKARSALSGVTASEAMSTNMFVIGESASIAAVRAFMIPTVEWIALTDSAGVVRSVVSANRVRQAPERVAEQPVSLIATPIEQGQAAWGHEDLARVLSRTPGFPLVVVDNAFKPLGVVGANHLSAGLS